MTYQRITSFAVSFAYLEFLDIMLSLDPTLFSILLILNTSLLLSQDSTKPSFKVMCLILDYPKK